MRVTVAWALPSVQYDEPVELPEGARVQDALDAVSGREPFASLDLAERPVGVFNREVDRDHVLADGDRVELYRPLEVDPMTARARRAEAQRGAG